MSEENTQDLVEVVINKTKSIFYVVTEETLENIKKNSIFGDVFFFISSVSFGFYFSTKADVYLIFAILFFVLALYSYYSKYSLIKNITDSGELGLKATNGKNISGLVIKKATYGSPSKTIDVTKELQKLVVNNSLGTRATNDIAGDPDVGVNKKLHVIYEIDGNLGAVEYPENSEVKLP